MMWSLLTASLLAAAAPDDPAHLLVDAIRTGTVGERYDGYLDFVSPPDDALRRAVGSINIRRRALYVDLGHRRRVAPNEVGIATACKLFLRVPEGGAYQLSDGQWRVRRAGTPLLLPAYCPNSDR